MVNHYCKRRQWLGQECSTLSPSSTSRYTHHRPPAICKCWAHPHASDSKICPLSPGAGKRQVVVASATNPILCGRAYRLCGFHGRKSHTPTPHNKGALFCFESLMLALSKTAIPIPRRLHSLPSFALFRLLGALSLCFYSVGRLCDSGKGTKNLAWNWGFLSGTIWFLALAC